MSSPWVERFEGILDNDLIRSRARLVQDPSRGLNKVDTNVAIEDLRRALQGIYIPTTNSIEIMKLLLSKSISYSRHIYPTNKAYLKEVYSPREDAVFPSCLTGPAGVGKSQLIKALSRVMPESQIINPDDSHSNFRMESMWVAKTENLVPMLKALLPNDTGHAHVDDLVKACRRVARRDGISLIVIDELQSFSTSSAASSSVTNAILKFSNMGVPLVYACNYSLCHKFLRRDDHDKHRLIGDPLVLLPDSRGSQDWHEFVDECCRVSDGILSFADSESVTRLYNYCAGIKRIAVELMCLSYKIARTNSHKKATIDHVEAAYGSSAFMVFRKDVEILLQQEVEGMKIKEDLWCPFELPKNKQQRFTEQCRSMRQEKIASSALRSSLSVDEARNLKLIDDDIRKKSAVPIIAAEKKQPKPRMTTELLIANAKKFRERMEGDK